MEPYKVGQNHPVENLCLKFSNHPEGHWTMQIGEAMALYNLLKKLQPTQILDLGTGIGCSAALAALATDNSRIITVEQNKRIASVAQELIPYELKQKIQFETSPAIAINVPEIDPFRFWSAFVQFTWAKWDFIIIDGPGPFMIYNYNHTFPNGDKFLIKDALIELPNGDIINLLSKIAPGTKIFIQGRKEAVKLYKRYFAWYLDVLEDGSMYTLFERTKEPLAEDLSNFKNSDTHRGRLEELGYFKQN